MPWIIEDTISLFQSLSRSEECQGKELSERRGAALDAEERRKGEQKGGERKRSKPRIEDATIKSLKLAQRLQCLGYKKSAPALRLLHREREEARAGVRWGKLLFCVDVERFMKEATYMGRPGAGGCKGRGKTGGSASEADWRDTGGNELWALGRDGTWLELRSGFPERGERWPDLTVCEAVSKKRERER